jgi:CO/xanthine dehydrogenase Mo-binding subunit
MAKMAIGERVDTADGKTEAASLRLVGRRTRRSDAPERLTGQTRFTGDLGLPGALRARFVRSPYASARVVSVDASEALTLPGVVVVLTARDLPVADIARAVQERKVPLALDRVLHAGQPVAVVLAESEAAAADGAAAVQVEYEPLPPVVEPLAATRPDAPVVREQRERDEAELAMHGAATSATEEVETPRAPNVASTTRYERGDVKRGFAEAEVVVEREYRTSWVHQGYMEPIASAAMIDPLGHLTIYTSTQALFYVRNDVARTLGVPHHQVKVYAMPVGGAFGAKFGLVDPLVAALARAVRRPVQLTYTRMDEFVAANPAPQSVIRVKVGARSDGTLTTLMAELLFDTGSNPGAPVGIAALLIASTYRWEHLLVDGAEVLTHKAGQGAYRAPGVPQAAFALESTVDEAAHALGMDPFELRRKNAVREGDPRAAGRPWPRIGLVECLEAAEPIYRAERAAAGPNEGVGVALGGWPGGMEPGSAVCRLDTDGTLQVTLGAVDLTGTHTTFQVIAAETFGLADPGQVRVSLADTDSAPYAGASGGSKVTYTIGVAVQRAAQEAREQVLRIAATELEASADDLEIRDGRVQVRGAPSRAKTLQEICALSTGFGAKYEPVYGRGQVASFPISPGFCVHVVRARVDPETGRVQPVRYVAVQDVGRAINPAAVEGQMFGGAVQGVGWGLYERMAFDADGTLLSASLLDYAIPTAMQSPELRAVIVEVPSEHGPYGARGVGEPPVIPGAAAIANAVRDATGARVTELPLTAERVFRAITATDSAAGSPQPATHSRRS